MPVPSFDWRCPPLSSAPPRVSKQGAPPPTPAAHPPRPAAPARLPTAYRLGDSAIHLHALTSLIAQAERLLLRPYTTHATRNSAATQIGELLGSPAATAARRYRNKP